MEYEYQAGALSQASEQHKVLRNTYWLLGASMVPAVIGASVGASLDLSFMAASPIVSALVMFALMMGALFLVTALRNSAWGIAAMLGFTFVSGVFMGPILQVALGFRNGGELITLAAGGTAVIFFSLATLATISKKDFSFLGKFLFIGLILLLVASLANLFLHLPVLSLTISAVAVLLFSAYILFDVSQIVNGGETNYISATLALYLDIINVFQSLLALLGIFGGERD